MSKQPTKTDARKRFHAALRAVAKQDLSEGERTALLYEALSALMPECDLVVRRHIAELPDARRKLADRLDGFTQQVRQGVPRPDLALELSGINEALWTMSDVDYTGSRQCRVCAKILPAQEATDWPEPDLCPDHAARPAEDHDDTTPTTDGDGTAPTTEDTEGTENGPEDHDGTTDTTETTAEG